MIVSASGTHKSIDETNLINNKWLMYQPDLANFDLNKLKKTSITIKGGKTTSMLFNYGKKYVFLMAGSNTLPDLDKYLNN